MLEEVKMELRVSNNSYDNEINNLIDACKSDLETSGVAPSYFEEENLRALIKHAIRIYCKAQFGYDNPDAQRLNESYELLKQKLAIVYHNFTKEE